MRIDKYLFVNNYFNSRQKAQDALSEGIVFINGSVVKKDYLFKEGDIIEVKETKDFVARSGFKLEQALQYFQITLTDKVVLDIGASTGGFSECALNNGAKLVYAVDVGQAQLVEKLKNDCRVINMEKTNARNLTKANFDYDIDFICMDVSFISIELLLPIVYDLLVYGGSAVILIKPQFEVGKTHLNKQGIVKNATIIKKMLDERIKYCQQLSFEVAGLIKASLKGRKGNEEYLLYLRKQEVLC